MSPQRPAVSLLTSGVPRALFPLPCFIVSTALRTIRNYICLLIYLVSVSPLRLGAPCRRGPCCLVPKQVAQGMWCVLDGQCPSLSLPSCPLIPQLYCLCPSAFLSSHSHFSLILSSMSHLHVSLWVCLSVSHAPSLSPAWPWHWKHTFVLWPHKKVYGISQAGDATSLSHYPLPSPSSLLV